MNRDFVPVVSGHGVILFAVASALGLVLLLVVYTTVSINARANREDEVVSAPGAEIGAEAFMRALGGAAGQAPTTGNAISAFQNGDGIFPAMLATIAGARTSVHFVTYVYEPGTIAEAFGAAFIAAASRGVDVRIVLDADGAKRTPPALIARMRDAGCDVRWYRRAQWYDWEEYNRRNHRKLLVVDGVVAFTGGVGIADQWSGDGGDPHHWRDTQVRLEGPAVAGLQRIFVDSWSEATGELILGTDYFPPLAAAGETPVCVVQSNPVNATSTAQRTVAAVVAGATRSLAITNAYFVPTPAFIDALCRAVARGVDVRILMPGPYHNKPSARRASRDTWTRLLAGGVRLFEHQRTMVHAKVIVADEAVVCVGSINFDPRSFALNTECAVVAFDAAVARSLLDQFEADLTRARAVEPADLARRSNIASAVDAVAYWFRAQL